MLFTSFEEQTRVSNNQIDIYWYAQYFWEKKLYGGLSTQETNILGPYSRSRRHFHCSRVILITRGGTGGRGLTDRGSFGFHIWLCHQSIHWFLCHCHYFIDFWCLWHLWCRMADHQMIGRGVSRSHGEQEGLCQSLPYPTNHPVYIYRAVTIGYLIKNYQCEIH